MLFGQQVPKGRPKGNRRNYKSGLDMPEPKIITMRRVASSNLWCVGHDGENLFVIFKKGTKPGDLCYLFKSLSEDEYEELLTADSIGQHFSREIKPFFPTFKDEIRNVPLSEEFTLSATFDLDSSPKIEFSVIPGVPQ